MVTHENEKHSKPKDTANWIKSEPKNGKKFSPTTHTIDNKYTRYIKIS